MPQAHRQARYLAWATDEPLERCGIQLVVNRAIMWVLGFFSPPEPQGGSSHPFSASPP